MNEHFGTSPLMSLLHLHGSEPHVAVAAIGLLDILLEAVRMYQ